MALEKSKSIEADLDLKMGPDTNANKEEKEPKLTFAEKAKFIFTNITVEPIMICYILPNVMASLTVQNLNLEKACRVNLRYDETVCDALASRNSSGYSEQQEVAIQRLVAQMNAYKNIIQSLVPSILLMFIGSWSDRHNRRKPIMLIPLIGEMVATMGFLLCTYFFYQLPIEFSAMSEAIPPALAGGWFSLFTGIFSYVSMRSTEETRTLRIGAVSIFTNVGIAVAIALSGILYREIGFYGVFCLSLLMYATGFVYGALNVKEIPLPEKSVEKKMIEIEERKKKNFCQDFFDLKHISETLDVAFKKGEKGRKKRICVIMVLVMLVIGPMHGEMNVMYLFVRYKFGWNELDYSMYSTFNFVIHSCGTVFSLMFFSKYLKWDDAVIGMLSSGSKIASSLVYAFAPTSTVFYLGAIVEMLNGTSFIAMRSITSKLVPPEELGKINSLFGVSEALMPLIYGPMYSIVYNKTLAFMPGSFLLLGGFLTTPCLIIFFWLYKEHQKDAIEAAKLAEYKEKLMSEKRPKDEVIYVHDEQQCNKS